MVHELGWVRHEPIAADGRVLALEELRIALVASVALEEEHDVLGGIGDLTAWLHVLSHIEVLS